MAQNNETVEPTVTIKRKNLKLAGWIAGGALALGATFAIGAAVGHEIPAPFGGDLASGQGQHGPGDGDNDHGFGGGNGGPGDGDGDRGGPQGGFQAPSQGGQVAPNGQSGQTAPSAPTAPTAPSTPTKP